MNLRKHIKQMNGWDVIAACLAVISGLVLLVVFCSLATSCAPRFHPYQRPQLHQLNQP